MMDRNDNTGSDLWSIASADVQQETEDRLFLHVRSEAARYWPVLAAATSERDFTNRHAMIESQLRACVASVVGEEYEAYEASLSARLDEALAEDFKVVAGRRAERDQAHRASLRHEVEAELRAEAEDTWSGPSSEEFLGGEVAGGGSAPSVPQTPGQEGDPGSEGGPTMDESAGDNVLSEEDSISGYASLQPFRTASYHPKVDGRQAALVDDVMDWEDGNMDADREAKFFQGLIDSGQAWQLQGMYGRRAQQLIDAGVCHAAHHAGLEGLWDSSIDKRTKCSQCHRKAFDGKRCHACGYISRASRLDFSSTRKQAWTPDGSDITPLADEIMGATTGYESDDELRQKLAPYAPKVTGKDIACLTDYNYHTPVRILLESRPEFTKFSTRKTAGWWSISEGEPGIHTTEDTGQYWGDQPADILDAGGSREEVNQAFQSYWGRDMTDAEWRAGQQFAGQTIASRREDGYDPDAPDQSKPWNVDASQEEIEDWNKRRGLASFHKHAEDQDYCPGCGLFEAPKHGAYCADCKEKREQGKPLEWRNRNRPAPKNHPSRKQSAADQSYCSSTHSLGVNDSVTLHCSGSANHSGMHECNGVKWAAKTAAAETDPGNRPVVDYATMECYSCGRRGDSWPMVAGGAQCPDCGSYEVWPIRRTSARHDEQEGTDYVEGLVDQLRGEHAQHGDEAYEEGQRNAGHGASKHHASPAMDEAFTDFLNDAGKHPKHFEDALDDASGMPHQKGNGKHNAHLAFEGQYREAVITNSKDIQKVDSYLPRNYRATWDTTGNIRVRGTDQGEWTLDRFVIPRLHAGLVNCREVEVEQEPI